MLKSQINSATLVGATLAGVVVLMVLQGPFTWLASIGALILVLILLSYDRDGYRSLFQSVAFSAVCGFGCALASGAVFQLMGARGEVHLNNGQWSTIWLPITCAFATAIFFAIDRARMSGREPLEMREARRARAPQPGFIPRTASPVPAPPPEPVSEPPARMPVQEMPAPTFREPQRVEPPPPPLRIDTPPVIPQPSRVEPALPRSFIPEAPVTTPASEALSGGPAAAEPALPGPAPIIPRTGKEAMIYVSLVGEGLNVLRSVKAEHLGRDFYRITEPMPEGETWQFQPGQVVRCKKKSLSTGKGFVAVEEAPRAR